MTDETLKPKRRRWRWIVVGVLSFVVGVAGWWYWPRGDARFVGKWRVLYDEEERFELENSWVRFDRNGAGQFQNPDGTLSLRFPWTLDGERFRFGTPIDSVPDLFAVGMAQEYVNPGIVFGETEGILSRIEPDMFEILVETFENEPRSTLRFRRIPE